MVMSKEHEQLKIVLEALQKENSQLKEQLISLKREKVVTKHINQINNKFAKMLKVVTYSLDMQQNLCMIRGAVKELTGYETSDFLEGKVKWEQLIHPQDLNTYLSHFENEQDPQVLEYRIINADGQTSWLSDMKILLRDFSGKPISIEGLAIDITRRIEAEEEFLERQAHLDSILNSVQDVIWSVTPDTFDLLYINPAAEKVYGYSLEEIYKAARLGSTSMKFHYEMLLEHFSSLLQRGWFEEEYSIELPNGQTRWLRRRAHFALDAHGVLARIDGIDSDITLRKQAEEALQFISHHDGLTHLYNRFFFEKEVQRIDREGYESVGIIICDVDGLKTINDNLGHAAGDQLLIECAKLLKECFCEDNIIARIGGDEFTIILPECTVTMLKSSVHLIKQKIEEFNSHSNYFPLQMSIGYALKTSKNTSMSDVFREADNKMYEEKHLNRKLFKDTWQKYLSDK